MKRSGIVRFQVFLLLLLAGLLVWRATSGPEAPEAAVALVDLSVGELATVAFDVAEQGRVRIEASGSTAEAESSELVAYPWILDRTERTVVWKLEPDSTVPNQTLRTVIDTTVLQAGTYRAYFTTYGPTAQSRSGASFLGLKRYWTNDESSWQFLLSPVDSILVTELDADDSDSRGGAAVWSSGRIRNRGSREGFIVAESAADIHVLAVAEVCTARCDEATIENAVTGEVVWALSTADTGPAGGMAENRRYDGSVRLEAGVYRVRVVMDGTHAYGSWRANPPWDPEAWGLRITAETDAVREYDPWNDVEPYVAMLEVGNDEVRRTSISVDRPVRVVVDASGEISTGGNRYDYAWIEREDRSRIWEMDSDHSGPAGGDVTNRREVAFLDLQPGRYVVYYQSDGSHSYGDWRRSRPTHPDRWGVAVFPLASDKGDSAAVRIVEDVPDAPPAPGGPGLAPPDVPSPIPAVAGETIFSAVGLGNDEERRGEFELDRPMRVRIVALGEITRSGRYDYGWIESESGEFAWEMTIKNTKEAGGDTRNRKFDSVITLPAGRYVAHFRTDFSHAFGDFSDGAPPDPASWGMRIVRTRE